MCFFQSGPTIPDDEDGHLSYKLGDVIENDVHRCKLNYKVKFKIRNFIKIFRAVKYTSTLE
jgi:hypothetical protein